MASRTIFFLVGSQFLPVRFFNKNLPAEILKICKWVMNNPGSEATKVQAIAQSLVYNSRACMFHDRVSPFELEARKHGRLYHGGVSRSLCRLQGLDVPRILQKVDDVTVVVALVRET
jgi:hypothetical protein